MSRIETYHECQFCLKTNENREYKFCSISCQFNFYYRYEYKVKKMIHKFVPHKFAFGNSNPKVCNNCALGMLDHLPTASCHICKVIIGFNDAFISGARLTCAICADDSSDEQTTPPSKIIPRLPESAMPTSANEIIAEAARIDKSIISNGDVYNAKVVAISEIKRAIDTDDSIPQDEKNHRLHNAIAERYAHLKQVVFNLDNQRHDAMIEQLAISESLREFGNSIRKDIREKIRIADESYQSVKPKPIIKPKVKSEKKSAFDLLVDSVMKLRTCSREQAILKLRENGMTDESI